MAHKLFKLSAGRSFYGRRQFLQTMRREIASVETLDWYCNDCGFVPATEIRDVDEQGMTGICKCGKRIDQIPF